MASCWVQSGRSSTTTRRRCVLSSPRPSFSPTGRTPYTAYGHAYIHFTGPYMRVHNHVCTTWVRSCDIATSTVHRVCICKYASVTSLHILTYVSFDYAVGSKGTGDVCAYFSGLTGFHYSHTLIRQRLTTLVPRRRRTSMMYVPLVLDHKQPHSWRYQGKKADSAGSGDGDDDDE